jgi:hypothetical protein
LPPVRYASVSSQAVDDGAAAGLAEVKTADDKPCDVLAASLLVAKIADDKGGGGLVDAKTADDKARGALTDAGNADDTAATKTMMLTPFEKGRTKPVLARVSS